MIDSTRERYHAVVGQDIAEKGIQSGIINVRLKYALA
jgi:hypothetical protein